MRGVLDGTKLLLDLSQINNLYMPPKHASVTCEDIYEEVRKDTALYIYFPNSSKPPSKHFLMVVDVFRQDPEHSKAKLHGKPAQGRASHQVRQSTSSQAGHCVRQRSQVPREEHFDHQALEAREHGSHSRWPKVGTEKEIRKTKNGYQP